ncbi:MAG: crossover junction endodeoxyribonuclease RuvC [Clostridia bacterium]|nr:crossover junction endodeoxyribonuclease RuvC [Clostridia bacterium]MBQ3663942.1 crossover junction endodeoxyribonuclease RuvC [Clostridia bacterium]MBQ5757347.1 crossover junction endodeoxyribonuclease RuvC [Clostridia bacterium]MCR5072965.1 crossover junction endodeoxyribonuclease RuvC [Clostridiales bacterium]
MRVLGIDPGYALLGYGIVDTDGSRFSAVDYGVIETFPDMTFPERLERISQGMIYILDHFCPDAVVFEELFFYHNITTAIAVGAARGVALLEAQKKAVPLYEYTPKQIKQVITGNGSADKKAIQHMVMMYLGMREIPKPDDAADALACAITFLSTMEPAREEYRIK